MGEFSELDETEGDEVEAGTGFSAGRTGAVCSDAAGAGALGWTADAVLATGAGATADRDGFVATYATADAAITPMAKPRMIFRSIKSTVRPHTTPKTPSGPAPGRDSTVNYVPCVSWVSSFGLRVSPSVSRGFNDMTLLNSQDPKLK